MKPIAFAVVLLFSAVNSARILGVVPTPSYSHQIPFQPIFKELSRRGHQVTVITTNPQNDSLLTNLTEIDLSSSYDIVTDINIPKAIDKSFFSTITSIVNVKTSILDNTFSHPEVRSMIRNKSERFDVVMVEMLAPGSQAFSERFGCPLIGISSMDIHNRYYENIGNPVHPVLHPNFNLDLNVSITNRTFWERLLSWLYDYFLKIFYYYVVAPRLQFTLEQHFGKNFPSILEIEKKVSLLFVNTNLVLHPIRSLLPNVVRIGGGLHLKQPKPLPKDLRKLLDGAQRGAVYCSFGSSIKSKDLTVEIQEIMLKTFAQLPYLVLWKFEIDDLIETPENVITSKWFPQQDVLGHPNVVAFITQGGLQSIEEGIHNSVPFIGIPFVGDQLRNVKVLVDKGIALSLDLKRLTQKTFNAAIMEVIENPRYRNEIKKISKLMKDEPMTGLEKAVWWTEYVIRHKGAPHLRRSEIPFYQYYFIDVIGFCLPVVLAVVYFAVKMLKFVVRLLKYYFRKQKVIYE